MRDRRGQPGGIALGMLAGKWTVALLAELGDEPLRLAELERALVNVAHGTLSERLKQLARNRLVVSERVSGSGMHVESRLTERGCELKELIADAAILEGEWSASELGASGERIVRLIADPYTRAIRRALVDGPLSPAEIERSQPGLAHSTLLRRADRLTNAGLLRRAGRSGARRYELVDAGRRLARIVLRAIQCERRWAAPEDTLQSDVCNHIHMIAPLAQSPRGLEGVCRLMTPGEPDVDIVVARRRLLARAMPPSISIDGIGKAEADVWEQALLHGNLERIETSGDRDLLRAIILSLSRAISVGAR